MCYVVVRRLKGSRGSEGEPLNSKKGRLAIVLSEPLSTWDEAYEWMRDFILKHGEDWNINIDERIEDGQQS